MCSSYGKICIIFIARAIECIYQPTCRFIINEYFRHDLEIILQGATTDYFFTYFRRESSSASTFLTLWRLIPSPSKVTALRLGTDATACNLVRTQPMPAVNSRTIMHALWGYSRSLIWSSGAFWILIRTCFSFLPLGTPKWEPPPKERVGIFGEGCEIISSQLPLLYLLLWMFSRHGWRKFGQKSFPISPIGWTLTPTPLPTCTQPINSYHLYTLPNPLLYICGFFRPVVAYLLPLKTIITSRCAILIWGGQSRGWGIK